MEKSVRSVESVSAGYIPGKAPFYVASVSWGAASLYMLLELLRDPNKKLNMVLFVNMGKEFDALLKMRDKCIPLLAQRGIPYVEVDVSERFEYDFLHRPVKDKQTGEVHRIGYGWCGGPCRWGTRLKIDTIEKYYRTHLSCYHVYEYVGICYDEAERTERNVQQFTTKIYPLVERHITKKQALVGCYENGFFYEEKMDDDVVEEFGLEPGAKVYLYEILSNLSCYCCKNKNLSELSAMYYLLPKKYWQGLGLLQQAFPDEPLKGAGKSVFDLEKRFCKRGREVSVFDFWCPLPTLYETSV